MLTLAIETSGSTGSIALLDDARCLAEQELALGRLHGQVLVPEIRRLLRTQGKTPRDCQLVAVSRGPGSYTGLRVGVVCAKTLAWAVGCRIVGVDTLEAIASNAPEDVERVTVIADAQRSSVYVGQFVRDEAGRFVPHSPLRILAVEEWVATVTASDVLSGPGFEKPGFGERLPGRWLPADLRRAQARQIGILGLRKLETSGGDEAETLAPWYHQRSSAEQQWDSLGRP